VLGRKLFSCWKTEKGAWNLQQGKAKSRRGRLLNGRDNVKEEAGVLYNLKRFVSSPQFNRAQAGAALRFYMPGHGAASTGKELWL
jgi:hypothetical protein